MIKLPVCPKCQNLLVVVHIKQAHIYTWNNLKQEYEVETATGAEYICDKCGAALPKEVVEQVEELRE